MEHKYMKRVLPKERISEIPLLEEETRMELESGETHMHKIKDTNQKILLREMVMEEHIFIEERKKLTPEQEVLVVLELEDT